jgi:hypothetical protein
MRLFERHPECVTGRTVRKSLAWVSGRGFVDPVDGAAEGKGSESGRAGRMLGGLDVVTSPTDLRFSGV